MKMLVEVLLVTYLVISIEPITDSKVLSNAGDLKVDQPLMVQLNFTVVVAQLEQVVIRPEFGLVLKCPVIWDRKDATTKDSRYRIHRFRVRSQVILNPFTDYADKYEV